MQPASSCTSERDDESRRSKAAGLDLAANYTLPSARLGVCSKSADGTYLTQFDNQLEKGGEWSFEHQPLQFWLPTGTTTGLPIVPSVGNIPWH